MGYLPDLLSLFNLVILFHFLHAFSPVCQMQHCLCPSHYKIQNAKQLCKIKPKLIQMTCNIHYSRAGLGMVKNVCHQGPESPAQARGHHHPAFSGNISWDVDQDYYIITFTRSQYWLSLLDMIMILLELVLLWKHSWILCSSSLHVNAIYI